MKVIKEIIKETLKLLAGIIWTLSFMLGYMWMSIPEVMTACFAVNTGCAAVLYLIYKYSEEDEEENEGTG